ncbi:ATP-binding cassette domain-containing protein, partial [Actinocorallia lasiicapitis]
MPSPADLPTDLPTGAADAVTLDGVGLVYGWGRRAVQALDGLDAAFAPGAFVTLVGPSGCGKSTLLRLVA